MFSFIKSYIPIIKNAIVNNAQIFSDCIKKSTNKVENFINKQNIIGILLLGIIVFFFAKVILFSIEMYKLNKVIDSNWTIIVTAIIGLITIYATAFSNNLTKQNINSNDNKAKVKINENNNQMEIGKKWIDKNGDGIMEDDEIVDESNADNFNNNLDLI